MSLDIIEFKDILKKVRKDKKITQKKLAEISGLSFSMVSKLETGEQSNPSFDTVSKLAKALNVPLYYLYGHNHIDTEYRSSLVDFIEDLGYDVKFQFTPTSNMADFDEEPTRDYVTINNVEFDTEKMLLLEEEMKRTIDFFLKISK